MLIIKYIYNSSSSSLIHAPFLLYCSPWFIIFRTLTTKHNVKVFVYTKSNCTALVPFGHYLASSVGHRMPKLIKNSITFPPYQLSVIVGLILSDAYLSPINSKKGTINSNLEFTQSLAHFKYFWHVFSILSPYCYCYPYFIQRNRSYGFSYELKFYTRLLPCFTELRALFYTLPVSQRLGGRQGYGVKIIPADIYDILTPVALAHWIMGDGAKDRNGLIFCTDSYTVEDTIRLMNVLILRYRLDCTLRSHSSGGFRIYIKTNSMPLLRSIVLPFMHFSMLYKIQ